jgi:uncharacterized protein (TIGR03083 family)
MDAVDHLEHLHRDGLALADVAERSGLEAPVPTCPGWTLADLVRHTGGVHRWATRAVTEQLPEPLDEPLEQVVGGFPADDVLLDWFRDGHARLVSALRSAPPDLAAFTFLPSPSPLSFWARRQAHETAVHRADAESAAGAVPAFPATFAADGIDELLVGFASRPRPPRPEVAERRLALQALDAGRSWYVQLGPSGVAVTTDRLEGATTVRGSASDLYLVLWNRQPAGEVEVRGDPAALDQWRDTVRVRWTD